jgi:MoaA/NifB/PqqE/SkfB family radical SAM enzyme
MLDEIMQKGFQRRPEAPVFDAIQIEITSRCNIRCVMCPVTVLADRWRARTVDWELYLRIARAFKHIKYVHLQGWGEPLLHPRLFDMIKVAKDAGCRVGFTTNGTLLGPVVGQRLLDLDLDLLAVSIAGASPETHAAIRVGSDLTQILDNLRYLLDLRARQQLLHPKVEIFFLMTKSNTAELPAAVDLTASVGADELVATNLDYVPTEEQNDLKAFGYVPLRETFARAVKEAQGRAKAAGLTFRAYPLEPEEVAVCDANPLKILFVSCDGRVSPCTYLGLAGQAQIPRVFDGQLLNVPRVWFGDIREQELLEIWQNPAYRAFRQQFEARRMAAIARAAAVIAGLSPASQKALPPAPECCQSCPKLFGA